MSAFMYQDGPSYMTSGRQSVIPDVCKDYQQSTKVTASKERVKAYIQEAQ